MELKFVIESLLFTAQKPLNLRELREILKSAADKEDAAGSEAKAFKKVPDDALEQALQELEQDHARSGRSYFLACVAGSWQFVTRPEYLPWMRSLFGVKTRPPRLSQPALETLAIVAYRQPITRAEIEQIRGVAVDGVVATLLERGLLENAGRAEVVGRPMTYATTSLFLEYFGLRNLEELPDAEELRRIPVEKPESLLTAEAAPEGLATAPPPAADLASPANPTSPADPAENPVVPADTDTETSGPSSGPSTTATVAAASPETSRHDP